VAAPAQPPVALTELERGLVVGLLIGEGHFGGDGKYPHITLRMHVRHEAPVPLAARPLSALAPVRTYDHSGRHYFQWMARGPALAEDVLPVVEAVLTEQIDAARLRPRSGDAAKVRRLLRRL